MGFLAVILAAAVMFGTGAVWYMTLAKPWMKAVGRTEEDIKADKSPLPFIIAGVAAISAAGMMRHMFAASGMTGIWEGLVSGLGVGLFIVAPWVVLHYAFAGRPRSLWWIDAGHVILAFTLGGLVLGLFL